MVRDNAFYAMIDRSKYIQRWSLMRNTQQENLAEHSFMTAVFAHALAIIRQERFKDLYPQVDPNEVLAYALYHDINEVITGDLPTPVKYQDSSLESAYKSIEAKATDDMLSSLPEDLRANYVHLLKDDEDATTHVIRRLVKGADKLSAYAKCLSEIRQGNQEFEQAKHSTHKRLVDLDLPEVSVFLEEFMPSFAPSLDELRENKVVK